MTWIGKIRGAAVMSWASCVFEFFVFFFFVFCFFFFNDTATTEIYTLSLHDALPIFEVFNEHIESRGAVPYDNAVRYFHKDGSIVWVLCRGKVVEWSEDDKPLRMIGSHVDITPMKRAEIGRAHV